MKRKTSNRILAIILTFAMLMSMMLVFTLSGSADDGAASGTKTYTLNASDITAFAAGDKADYATEVLADFFTLHYSAKTKVEANSKTFSDNVSATNRINWGGSSALADGATKNAISFTTEGEATVTLWWVCGDVGRTVGIYDSSYALLDSDETTTEKNGLYITTFEIEEADTYYISNIGGNNNYYQISVTQIIGGAPSEPEIPSWSDIAAPTLTAVDNGNGGVDVVVNAVIGDLGADKLTVYMYYGDKEVKSYVSTTEADSYSVTFVPTASAEYTFRAVISRDGEEDKSSADVNASFTLPLAAPNITSIANKGAGKIEVIWTAVPEAEGYNVYLGDVLLASVNARSYVAENLTVGTSYEIKIEAVRGSDASAKSTAVSTATEKAEAGWNFAAYGPSTNTDNNGYIVNSDGSVTVYSEGGKGKVQTSSTDGVAFYYQAIPTEYNFTLRAKVSVDSWTYSNGQEGFGLLVSDRIGIHGDATDIWSNQYMVLASKIEYRYDAENEIINTLEGIGTKYSMKLGLGTLSKLGVVYDELGSIDRSNFTYLMQSLEASAGEWGYEAGTYNVIGNATSEVPGSLEERFLITEFVVEIQKNNTGYFITYYDLDGNVIIRQKNYGKDDLSMLDSEYVYAGLFASRNARATFSDISLTTVLASEDAPAEEKPNTVITPTITISSADVTTSSSYEIIIDSNVDGTTTVEVDGQVIEESLEIKAGVRAYYTVTLSRYGENRIRMVFTPDPDQDLGEGKVLGGTGNVYTNLTVLLNQSNYHRKNIYVSPSVMPYSTTGTGSKENPFDIYTAVENASPGQTIILMEGTYYLSETLRIQRGNDGTAENPIRMIADPEATTRPVLDFQRLCAGIVHGGDYWYFYGFDVTNSSDKQKGFQVSGNYNTLDQINAYNNGNTGIQISRYSGTDLFPDWPAYNLILNCTSYNNVDIGYEDADGFAAKLTVGEGNVFDGCIAYNNADDGWDLYAKVETGAIGSVTIRNCVAYNNGYLEDGTVAGNGNGFKMGGDSISGKHKLINSIAFNNLSKGIDSNSCPDIIVENCISFNNGRYNVAFYTNNATDTDFSATGIISFKYNVSGDAAVKDNLKPVGNQLESKYIGVTNYYWNGEACVNSAGVAITADMFVSLVYNGFTRNEDGTLNLGGFLELKDNAPENAIAVLGGTPSATIELLTDLEHNYSEEWVHDNNIYVHWHECECGDRSHIENHTFEWVIDKEPTQYLSGQKHEECTVCGYKRPAVEIYPEAPDTPDEPNTPDEPDTPDEPETPDGSGDGEQESFFTRIFNAIRDFFASIFETVKNFFASLTAPKE